MSDITMQYNRKLSVMEQDDYETGKGKVYLDHLLEPPFLSDKVNLYAKVTIKPGDALHVHQHVGEAESYFILSGTGLYNDNGREFVISAGYVTYTGDGESHGITNIGEDDLVFMALIIAG